MLFSFVPASLCAFLGLLPTFLAEGQTPLSKPTKLTSSCGYFFVAGTVKQAEQPNYLAEGQIVLYP
eukprot:1159203-Pelagomonas_calceolata.AAC.10